MEGDELIGLRDVPRNAKRVAVTGADGLIGWHLRAFWYCIGDVTVVPLGRERFGDDQALADDLSQVDAVVHLAGLNRGDDDVLEATNVELTRRLIQFLPKEGQRPHIVFASSTHRDRDTAYGRAKKRCSEILSQWAEEETGRFTELILPNVFGEHGKPFFNSAVSTFCHLLAAGGEPQILQDQELHWLHAQAVAELIDETVRESAPGSYCNTQRVVGTQMRVSHLLDLLREWDSDYCGGVVPAIEDPFHRDLFNTYRSYLFPERFPVRPPVHGDARGRLFESVKARSGGQCFVSSTVPGVRRGGHYHRRKFERFLVVEGRARIRVRRILKDRVDVFEVDGSEPAYVDMPTLHTHDLENIGTSPLVTLFWASDIFDPDQPDTHLEPVRSELLS